MEKNLKKMYIYIYIPVYMNLGFKYVETNVELESNNKVQAQWEYFERKQHKRRRCFKKSI